MRLTNTTLLADIQDWCVSNVGMRWVASNVAIVWHEARAGCMPSEEQRSADYTTSFILQVWGKPNKDTGLKWKPTVLISTVACMHL